MKRPRLAAVGVGLVLAACAGPAIPSASPTPSAEPSAVATELSATAEALPPGTYTRSSFEPSITFTLGGGWRGVQLLNGFFDVQQQVGSPRVIAVQFARPAAVFGNDGAEEAATAREAAEILAANPDFEVLATSDAQVGGLNGFTVELGNATNRHVSVMTVPPGPLGIDPHRRLWVSLFDTPDGLLAIMVGGADDNWDEALATAEPVLESVHITIP